MSLMATSKSEEFSDKRLNFRNRNISHAMDGGGRMQFRQFRLIFILTFNESVGLAF
jgi:hypothetical protein